MTTLADIAKPMPDVPEQREREWLQFYAEHERKWGRG